MKLLVDIGNSRVKWACLDGKELTESNSFDRSKSGIKAALNKAWKALNSIDEVLVANVAGDKIAQQLAEWTEKHWQLNPRFILSEKKRFGVNNAYDQPETLGVDRWLSLVTIRQNAKQACCLIDCGTAITVDVITEKGQHQGGLILPGLGLMRSMLATGTEALTEETDSTAFSFLATNTFSAIQAGTLYTASATLERLIQDLQQNFDNQIRFVITGGDALAMRDLLPDCVELATDTVLQGLKRYALQKPRRSTKKAAENN